VKIKRLYIKDFGIFYHQKLENLAPGMVLMGGWNRAGKSTFLQILRYLGFGFPRSPSLPPARKKHEVEGEIRLETGEDCHFQLQGAGEPVVSYLDGGRKKSFSMPEIYGNLDPFTYRQVFTVSLDELQRLPREISRNEQEKLQAVLLGAGFAEIARLPQLEEELRKKAVEIGGKYGKPGVQRFKEYSRQITAGMEERRAALRQVDEYRVKEEEQRQCRREIDFCRRELAVLRVETDGLDVLKSNYDKFQQYSELELRLTNPESQELLNGFPGGILSKVERLQERYEETTAVFEENRERFRREIGVEDTAAAGEKLLREKKELRRWARRLSGLKEKAENLRDRQEQWEQEKQELTVETVRVNEAWRGDFDRILAIKADNLEQNRLVQTVEEYKNARQELESCRRELEEQKTEVARMEKETGEGKTVRPVLNRYFAMTLLFVALGTGLAHFYPLLGVVTVIAGLIGVLLYLTAEGPRRREQQFLRRRLLEEKERLVKKQREKLEREKALHPRQKELDGYRQALGLPAETSPEMIKDYFRQVQELKRRIGKWRAAGERLQETRGELEEELRDLYGLGGRLQEIIPFFSGDEEWSEEFFAGLEQAVDCLELAEKLEESKRAKEKVETDLCTLLNFQGEPDRIREALAEFLRRGEKYKELDRYRLEADFLQKQILQALKTDRVKAALQAFCEGKFTGKEDLFTAFTRLFQAYTSREEVENRYREVRKRVEELEAKLDGLKENEQKLRSALEHLAATEKLENAQRRIDRARAEMRPLAENYAVYRAAAFLLERVRKNFLEKTRDTLLSGAATILDRLTDGRCQQVLPTDDLQEVDFKVVEEDGTIRETSAVLSRATQEQLFLAVRLSRIREIPGRLPVIFDDSLVNFDRYHLGRAVELLKELVRTHQVFVLTCHPHLVEAVRAEIPAVQYWRLEAGRFNPDRPEDLVAYLSGKQVGKEDEK